MSVTFTFHANGTLGTGCEHPCPVAGGCEEQQAYFYCDHMHEAREACAECALPVNVSNGNAAAILERLGLEFDYCGTVDASDFLGRALVANVGRDDSGVAPHEERGEGGALLVDCGQSVGYFDSRMAALVTLATVAVERGHGIGWS